MTLDECEKAYLTLSKRIFSPKRAKFNVFGQGNDFLRANGRFDTSALESAIWDVIKERADRYPPQGS